MQDAGFEAYIVGGGVRDLLLGKAPKDQRADAFDVWKTDLLNPNFAEYAELCGALGIRVDKKEQLDDAMAEAREHQGPAMVEIVADPLLV